MGRRHFDIPNIDAGDHLRCRPRHRLTERDLATLRAHKAAVLAWLRTELTRNSRNELICRACREHRFWLSIHGVAVCGTCHPPASSDLVAEWLPEFEDAP
jgi:hypothetical protein